MKKILTDEQKQEIIKAYSVDLVPMIKLAKDYGVSRVAIHKMLVKMGVNTKKGEGGATRVFVTCQFCKKKAERRRSEKRGRNLFFCGHACYYAWMKKGGRGEGEFIPWREGSRKARKMVKQYFNLQPHHVVHHKDRNQRNNELKNLVVFETQGDHMKHHRGVDVPYIWEGSKCRQRKVEY